MNTLRCFPMLTMVVAWMLTLYGNNARHAREN